MKNKLASLFLSLFLAASLASCGVTQKIDTVELDQDSPAVTETGDTEEEPELPVILDTEESTESEEGSENEEGTESEEGTEAFDDIEYTFTDLNATMYATQQVNVRDLPNSSGNQLGKLSKNDAVTVTGQCNETSWYRIEYNGGVGYVSNNYLSSQQASQAPAETPAASTPSSADQAPAETPAQTESAPAASSTSYSNNETMASDILTYNNDLRTSLGLGTLSRNSTLDQIAFIRACDMAENDYFDHYKDGVAQYTLVAEQVGYSYGWLGENLFWGYGGTMSGYRMYDGWYNSPGHYANMVKAEFKQIGIACVQAADGAWYGVQIFSD